MIWTEDEWPVLSPQRYAVIPQNSDITPDFITGSWEHITLTQVGEE